MIYLAALIGAAFGLLVIPFGLFLGLQVSPLAANILLFPVILTSWLTSTPIGDMTTPLRLVLAATSSTLWALIFAGVVVLLRKIRGKG